MLFSSAYSIKTSHDYSLSQKINSAEQNPAGARHVLGLSLKYTRRKTETQAQSDIYSTIMNVRFLINNNNSISQKQVIVREKKDRESTQKKGCVYKSVQTRGVSAPSSGRSLKMRVHTDQYLQFSLVSRYE